MSLATVKKWLRLSLRNLDDELDGPVMGVSWDGTGYGLDGTIWGGEFLVIEDEQVTRIAHFRSFPLDEATENGAVE